MCRDGRGRTERRLHGDRTRLLGLVAEAEEVDGLDTEDVGLSWDQAVDHEPETHSQIKI